MEIMGWWAHEFFAVIATFISVEVIAANTICKYIYLQVSQAGIGILVGSNVPIGISIG